MNKKNHSFFSYIGNKRLEAPELYNNIDLKNINYIVEPFCGTCALSVYISSKHPKKYKYILNDNDERLIKFFKYVQSSTEEQIDQFNIDVNEKYKQLTKDNYKELLDIENIIDYYIIMKYSRFKCTRFMYDVVFCRNVVFDIKKFLIYDFIRNENIIFTCEDGIKCYEQYCNKKM
jgi:site-specific DNA-adenine methylase